MPKALIFITTLVYAVCAFLNNLVKLNWSRLFSILASIFASFSLISLQYYAGLTPNYLRFVLVLPYRIPK